MNKVNFTIIYGANSCVDTSKNAKVIAIVILIKGKHSLTKKSTSSP